MTVNRNLNAPSYEIQEYQSTIQDNEPLSSSFLRVTAVDADVQVWTSVKLVNQSVICCIILFSRFTCEIGKLSARPKNQHFLWVVFSVTTQWSDVQSDRRQHSHGILHGKSQHRTYQSEEIRSAGSRTQNYVQSTSIGERQRRTDHKSCYQQVCMNLGSTKFYINTLFNIGKDMISVITTGWARELTHRFLFTILRDVLRFCYVQGEYKSNGRT